MAGELLRRSWLDSSLLYATFTSMSPLKIGTVVLSVVGHWSNSRVKALVPSVTEWNLFHKDYETYNVKLLLHLLERNAVLQLETL